MRAAWKMKPRYSKHRVLFALLSSIEDAAATSQLHMLDACLQEAYVLHDGPPYANGELHIGELSYT